MKIKDFMKATHYVSDGALFFVCTENWLNQPEGVEQAYNIELDELLRDWGEEVILEWTVCPQQQIGFLIE